MDADKEEFGTLRKAECQSFILMKTKNLNVKGVLEKLKPAIF